MSDGTTPAPLSHDQLPTILGRIHSTLVAHREEVDALNVFPVPDGDTGTNMVATAKAALKGLDEVGADAHPEERSRAVAQAALRGARGNSGVILSQFIRALVTELAGAGELDVGRVAVMLEWARELAYEAVADPVEGTILTTMSQAAIRARTCAQDGLDLGTTLASVLDDVESTTQDTLQMLKANRDAGVVDAGARGFGLVVGALHEHVTGAPFEPAPVDTGPVERSEPFAESHETGSLEFRYEVQYLLDAGEGAVPRLRERLRGLGDSVTVVASSGVLSVHVHTNDVGPAIEAGLDHGRPSDISVVHFQDEMAERADGQTAELGCVAVLPRGRLGALAREHGVVSVPGAGGELPSVDDLLRGIRRAQARHVLLLPGNRNVVPTARQAREVAADEGLGQVEVVAAVNPPSVVAALAVFDPSGEPDVVAADMEEAVKAVRAGEVVAAVRDANTPIGQVREGQYLTIVGEEVVGVSDDPIDALRALVDRFVGEKCEVLTLIVGADVGDDERDRARGTVETTLGGVEVELIDGRQRPARYLVGVE